MQVLHSKTTMQCFFAPCRGKKKEFKNCREAGIRTLISRSQERGDGVHEKLQSILSLHGANASVMCHKSCYSSYTSVSRNVLGTKKKSSGWPLSDEPPARLSVLMCLSLYQKRLSILWPDLRTKRPKKSQKVGTCMSM